MTNNLDENLFKALDIESEKIQMYEENEKRLLSSNTKINTGISA